MKIWKRIGALVAAVVIPTLLSPLIRRLIAATAPTEPYGAGYWADVAGLACALGAFALVGAQIAVIGVAIACCMYAVTGEW